MNERTDSAGQHQPHSENPPPPTPVANSDAAAEALDLGPKWEDTNQWLLLQRRLKESSAPPPGASRDSHHPTIQQGLEPMPEEALSSLASDLETLATLASDELLASLGSDIACLIASHRPATEPADQPDSAAPSQTTATQRGLATPASSSGRPQVPAKTGVFVTMDQVLSRIQDASDRDWAVVAPNSSRSRASAVSGFRRYLHELPGGAAFVDSAGQWKTPAVLRAVALVTVGLASAIGILALSSYLVSEHNAAQARARAAETKPLEIVQREAVNSVLRGYFGAETWEERLRWVRSPELVQPKMQAWYGRHPDPGPQEIRKVSRIITADYGGIRCVVAGVLLQGQIKERPVILEWRHNRFYWIDWETHAGYQDKTPEELFASPIPLESDLRCVLDPSDYYNGEFSDAARWQCYSIDYPGNNEDFFGYVARGSGAAEDLDRAFNRRSNLGALIRVKTLPAASPFRQLEIIELRENSWIPQYPAESRID